MGEKDGLQVASHYYGDIMSIISAMMEMG